MQVLSFLSLGSNIGRRRANLKKACGLLKASGKVKILNSSPVYETEPVGGVKQREFLNAVLKIRTSLPPLELLLLCKEIEKRMKRKKTVKWGPRIIDIDLVLFGKKVVRSKRLTVPHKELQNREFVLKPLTDLDPNGRHPVTGRSFRSMLRKLSGDKKTRKVWTKI